MSFFHFKTLKITPSTARLYLFFALLLIALPTIITKMMPSHEGKLLVASGRIIGEPFEKSVLYLQSHNGYGARGVILNIPLEERSASALQLQFPLADKFYYGGPVGVGQDITLLIPNESLKNGYEFINIRKLRLDNLNLYNKIVTNKALMSEARIISGYAGWGLMQLNREIQRGGWNVLSFDRHYLDSGSRQEIWARANKKLLEQNKIKNSVI